MAEPSWGDEETVRLRPPVDPWPDAQDGTTQPFPAVDTPSAPVGTHRRRQVYGYVYELITGDPRDGMHPYVGKTTETIHQRVHGSRGHTSPASVAKDPWKARILPGRAGYRCLKTIYATASEAEDEMRLGLAESILIDELKTTHNDQRPIRPVAGPAPRKPKPERKPVTVPWRLVGFLLVWVAFSILAARIAAGGHLPLWLAPLAALIPAWPIFLRLHRVGSWLAGNPVPRQPTSRRRPRPARRRRRR